MKTRIIVRTRLAPKEDGIERVETRRRTEKETNSDPTKAYVV